MKTFLTVIISLIVGIVLGIAGTVFFYPFFFPPPEVNEQVQNIAAKHVYAIGTFVRPLPVDKLHWGKGNMSIYQQGNRYEIFLHKNFQVGHGPAFHIYVSEQSNVNANAPFKQSLTDGKSYDLGVLKSFKGSQVYAVPPNIDMTKIKSIVVWCKAFNQLIASANVERK